jgi:hypothetical protein
MSTVEKAIPGSIEYATQRVSEALREQFGGSADSDVYVIATFPDRVVYRVYGTGMKNSSTKQVGYDVDDSGNITFDTPVDVEITEAVVAKSAYGLSADELQSLSGVAEVHKELVEKRKKGPPSSVYPDLERKKGNKDNWVEAAGGLPSYIERIAKHLHYEQGFSISRAIATAVNQVKKWAAGGGGVKADTRAKAAKAVAQWEAKKLKTKAKKVVKGEAVLDDEDFQFAELIEKHRDKKGSTAHHKKGYKPKKRTLAAAKKRGMAVGAPASKKDRLYPYLGTMSAAEKKRVAAKKKKVSPKKKAAPSKRGTIDEDLGGSAEAGLKLLSASQKQRHPRAQVQTLRKMAKIALGKAERMRKYSNDEAGAKKQEKKAKDALAAMQKLNRDHKLGFGR